MTLDASAALVLDRIDERRAEAGLAPMSPAARTDRTILARLRGGATVEDLLAIVDAFGELVRREPDKRTLLNATTPFTAASGDRGGGFAWGMRMVEEQRARGVVVERDAPAWLLEDNETWET